MCAYVCISACVCVCAAAAAAAAAVLTCIIYGLPACSALLCSGTLLFFVGVKRARRAQQQQRRRIAARSLIAAVA